jgi:cytoskeletal protein CcmA (bactofilin family)
VDDYLMASGGAIALATGAKLYGGALTTGAFSAATLSQVDGDVDCVGAAAIGASAILNGNVRSQAAFAVGALATVTGDITTVGAISFGPGVVYTGDMKTQAAVSIGANGIENRHVTITGNIKAMGAVSLGANLQIEGDVFATAISKGALATILGQQAVGSYPVDVPPSQNVGVLQMIDTRYKRLMNLPPSGNLELSINPDNKLSPGVYSFSGAWYFAAGRTIEFVGRAPTDTWVIQIDGAAALAGKMKLGPHALASNIYWYKYVYLSSCMWIYTCVICMFMYLTYVYYFMYTIHLFACIQFII